MADMKTSVPNVMPDALVEPISDMDLIVAKLQYAGELNKQAADNKSIVNKDKEV